jgi:hypothetical protein
MRIGDELNLAEFVSTLVERRGGLIEEQADGLYTVLPPKELWEASETLTITLDPEVAGENPEAQMVTYGSVLLDRWVESARRSGRTCSVSVQGLPFHSRMIPFREGVLKVTGCRVEVGEGVPKTFETLLFSFRVSFRSDERTEDRRVISVDRAYGRIERRFLECLADRTLACTGDGDLLETADRLDVRACYRIARDELERSITSEISLRKEELRSRREGERSKVLRYFDQSEAELAETLEKAEQDGEVAKRAVAKIAAVRSEKRRQLSQIESKYTLSVQVGLSDVLAVRYPKVVFPFRLKIPCREPTEVACVWDPLLKDWLAPPCPSCRKPTLELRADRRGDLTCPLCSGSGTSRA